MIPQANLSDELPGDCKQAAHWWFDFGFNVVPMSAATKHTEPKWDPWLAKLEADGHTAIDRYFKPEHELCAIVDSRVFILDADTPESLAALNEIEKAHDLIPNLVVKTSKGEHHYFRKAPGTYAHCAGYSSTKAPHKIDVRTGRGPTEGRGVIVLPPSTGKLVVVNEADDINDLVEVDQAFIDAVFRRNDPQNPPPRPSPPQTADRHRQRVGDCEAREILSYIDPACGYDDWLRVIFGIHDHYQGGEEGLVLADEWSQPAANYSGFEEIEYKWRTCSSDKAQRITWNSVCKLAEASGADLSDIRKRFMRQEKFQQWLDKTSTFSLPELERRPIAREILCDYFPVYATSLLVAMGGIGKTTWTASKVLPHLTDDLHVMFISAEDGEDDYQAKVHNVLYTIGSDGRYTDIEPADIADKLHVLNLKGQGVKLVTEAGGSFIPSPAADDLAEFVKTFYPRVRVLIFETVSRFAGGEDNERMEAIVSACDRIAIAINGACVLVHHTGKTQAREKVVDLYSGRGGSALGDNTRSMVVLTRLDADYTGSQPIVIDRGDLEAGRAFEVYHVRNSYGPTQDPEYYVTRHGYCHGPVLERVPIATDEELTRAKTAAIEARYNKAAGRLCEVIKAKGGKVHKRYFETETMEKIGLTQAQGRQLIAEMLDAGSLVEGEDGKKKILSIGRVN